MIKEEKVKTIEDLLGLISQQELDERCNRYRSSYLYRGLPNIQFKLETSLYRNCKKKQKELEKSILRNFTKYAATEDQQLKTSIWRQLIIGQHHGLPTRLLDWTYSPLIGLHFATSSEDLDNMNKNDAVIWKIDVEEINKLLPEPYKDALNKEKAFLFTVDMMAGLAKELDEYDVEMKNDSMVLIEPPSIDARIINQYSYFSIIPHEITNVEDFLNFKTENTVKYIIDKNIKWRARDMLDQINITERIMYPGLDGLSTWLKRHYFVK